MMTTDSHSVQRTMPPYAGRVGIITRKPASWLVHFTICRRQTPEEPRGGKSRDVRLHFRAMLRTFLAILIAIPVYSQPPIRGFPPDQLKPQHDRETKARAIPQPERIRTY